MWESRQAVGWRCRVRALFPAGSRRAGAAAGGGRGAAEAGRTDPRVGRGARAVHQPQAQAGAPRPLHRRDSRAGGPAVTRWRRFAIHLRRRARKVYRWGRLHIPRRVWLAFLIPGLLLGAGSVGYRWIEGEPWTYFDGFYMTAITITTIGYGEVHPLSNAGRFFTVVLAYSGIFTLAYFASELVRSVVTGELRQVIGRQWVDDQLASLSGHLIVCGHGRMGRIVCSELERQKRWFVLIDR